MTSSEHTLKSEIFDITKDNVVEKLMQHFGEVSQYIIREELENVKITTKVVSLAKHEATIRTEIMEKIRDLSRKR